MANYLNFTDSTANKTTTVGFLQGSQETLNGLITNGGAQEGKFYLTNDTHRLYIGRSDGSKIVPVPVNEGLITVANKDALPSNANPGEFYYLTTENILAVYSGGKGWVQLNPDTYLEGNPHNTVVSSKSNKAVDVSFSVKDSSGDTRHDNTGKVTFKEGSNVTITPTASIIGTNGLANDDGSIEISAIDTTYTIETSTQTNKGQIVLTPAGGNNTTPQSVNIIGNGGIAVTSDSTGIKVSLSDNAGGTNGSVTGQSGQYDAEGTNKKNTEGFSFTVVDNAGAKNGNINPIIKIGKDSTLEGVKFLDGTATLDVYTISETDNKISTEIEKKLQSFDSMTFQGTVGGDGATKTTLPVISDNVKNGDTYKVAATLTSPAAKIGDLVIAKGEEDPTTGYIKSDLEWVVVPSGDEATYVADALTHGISIKNEQSSNSLASLQLANTDGIITLADSGTTVDKIVTLGHKTYTAVSKEGSTADVEQTGKNSTTFTAITKLTSDEYGHITGAEQKTLTVVDTHNKLVSGETSSADKTVTNGTGATVTVTMNDDDSNSASASFNVTSSSLTITQSTEEGTNQATINADLNWGTF